MTIPLNAEQRAAAEHPPTGVLLVEALAGTGKTRTIRARIPHILRFRDGQKSFGAAPGGNALFAMLAAAKSNASKILVLAYGNAVAAEITHLLDGELPADDRKRVFVKTFHGQALSMIYKFRGYTGLAPGVKIDIVPTWKLLQALADWEPVIEAKLKRGQLSGLLGLEAFAHARGMTAEEAYPRVRQNQRQLMAMPVEDAVVWVPRLREFRLATGLITHDDTLPMANAMPSHCFQSLEFSDVIADELQDLNYQQRRLVFNLMAHATGFTGVGDPLQTVHEWQGSDPLIFKFFQSEYASRQPVTKHLTNNYRCAEPILAIANQVLSRDLASAFQLQGTGKLGPAVELYPTGKVGLIEFLRQREASGEAWKDMAVLYRTHKQAPELEMALAESGIPYILIGNSFFEQPEVMDMLAYFHLLYHPKPEYAYWRRVIDHCPGIGSYTAQAAWEQLGNPLIDYKRVPASVSSYKLREAWKVYQERAYQINLQAAWPENVAKVLKEQLLDYWGDRYGDNPDKFEDKLEIVNAFLAWIEKFEGRATGLDILLAVEAYEKGNRKKDPDADAVQLLTAHTAKGREWPTVALWNIGEGTFPQRAGTDAERAAENRLMYVALTRAKRALGLISQSLAEAWTANVVHYLPNTQAIAQQMLDLSAFDGLDNYLDAA